VRIYNTLTREVEEFIPLEKGKVKMYVCGPTPYDKSHIGHARTYIFFDFFRRFLEFEGFKVNLVINITDIDDKIIKKSRDFESWQQVADIYSRYFLEMLKKLRVKPPLTFPRVTNHIQEIIELVQLLLEKGYAYRLDDGIYFDTSKFADYGKLSRVDLKAEKVSRIEPNPNKRNPADFALWKFRKPGEPFWQAPFGSGRPGWHIECSAMSSKYLGKQFDIHGGGADLIFPHHENEIAQSEAAFEVKPWVRYWVHVAFLTINREKMSKSLGNIIGVDEILKKYEPEVLRYYLLSAHYRTQLDFTWEKLEKAKEQWRKIVRAAFEIWRREKEEDFGKEDARRELSNIFRRMIEALENDLHTPKAYAEMHEIADVVLSRDLDRKSVKKAREIFTAIDSIFAIIPPEIFDEKKYLLAKLATSLREELRKRGEYKISDRAREELRKAGIEVQDTEKGPLIFLE